MMKIVNGVHVKCSPQEEAEILAEWEVNRNKPKEEVKPSVEEKLAALEAKVASLEKK